MPRIVIVANNRSELGPLQSVIAALPEALVAGMDQQSQKDTPSRVLESGIRFFTNFLQGASTVVLVGDRYETLAAALAAMFLRIKIVHLHGGETTTGAFDNAMRHSITHITEQAGGVHCVATENAAYRVRRLINDALIAPKAKIHVTGAPGLHGVSGNVAGRQLRVILVTYHPETMSKDYGVAAGLAMLRAFDGLAEYSFLFCGVNNDPGGATITMDHQNWITRNVQKAAFCPFLSHDEYIRWLNNAALVVGNSSAGIIEAPWIGVPTVNIGSRQNGREFAPSVFNADGDAESIRKAINGALSWNGPWQPVYRPADPARIAQIVRDTDNV